MTITIEQGITIEKGVAIGQLPVISGGGITHTVAANGNARVSTSQAKFGTGSYTSNSLAGFLNVTPTTDFAFGTGNFTLELWYYPTSISGDSTVWGFRPVGANGPYSTITALNGGSLGYYANTAFRITSPAAALQVNQWNSIAVVRLSGSTRMYLNGTQTGSTYADTTNYLSGSCIIGANDFTQNGLNPIKGYLDEIRISTVARYSGNYTPATESFTPDSFTKLLIHCDGTNNSTVFTDSSNSI